MTRKTDKYRLKENRGKGTFEKYAPFLKVHEFGSYSRVHRIIGWKNRRTYQLMSDLELYYFILKQWDDEVVDIREQYPLLPLEQTKLIAEEIGIGHPPLRREEKTIITTDFLITYKKNNKILNMARAIKPQIQLKNSRTIEKLLIEEMYWKQKGIEWKIVTENSIPKIMAINLYNIYTSYFWAEEKRYKENKVNSLIYEFKNELIKNHYDILCTIESFEALNNWNDGDGLNFFKHLLTIKKIKTNMNIKFNFSNMKIWF